MKKSHLEALHELESRMLDGERITRGEILSKYTNDNDGAEASYLVGQLKRIFRDTHNRFCGLIGPSTYGLVNTKNDFVFAQQNNYSRAKAVFTRATQLYNEGVSRKLILPASMEKESLPLWRVSLPAGNKR